LTDRQATVLASAISDTTAVTPAVAKLQGIALAGVFQIIISHAGERTREGRSPTQTAKELHPIVENLLDDLDRWLSVLGPPPPGNRAVGAGVGVLTAGIARLSLV
jgi:hypothetical protein